MTEAVPSQPPAAVPASAPALPARVRRILHALLELASDALEREINATLNDYEQQAFQCAEQARNNAVQTRWLETLRSVRRTRPDVLPAFLAQLQSQLLAIRETATAEAESQPHPWKGHPLTLLAHEEMEESGTLMEVASRLEMRNSLPLYLMGQRFGVLAGKAGFEADALPIGPQALCRMLRDASQCLEISGEHRILLYRVFEKNMLHNYGRILAALTSLLVRERVLPHLQHVPFRAPAAPVPVGQAAGDASQRRSRDNRSEQKQANTDHPQPPSPGFPGNSTGSSSAESSGDTGPIPWWIPGVPGAPTRAEERLRSALSASSPPPQPPATSQVTPGFQSAPTEHQAPSAPPAADMPPGMGGGAVPSENWRFDDFRALLARRREAMGRLAGKSSANVDGPAAPVGEVQQALGELQMQPLPAPPATGKPTHRSITHLKQDLLAQLRRGHAGETPPTLSPQDNDTFDLMGLLFEEILKDVRPASPAAQLLTKLQVPLLRVALGDQNFFNDHAHPARQMMNAVAETGMYWLSEEEADSPLVQKLQGAVDRTLRDFDGDLSLFSTLLQDITTHLQTVARKAEVAERRHVEAARGKEKLAVARDHAAAAMADLLKDKPLPRFTQTLLEQAWTDVMALTALRHGEDSGLWKQQLGTAKRLVKLALPGAEPAINPDDLQTDVSQALKQVGYHDDEAVAIARRLVAPASGADDTSSRTELMMRMKTASRLGADVRPRRATPDQLTPAVLSCMERIRRLPFGAWFEFIINAQGDRARRRMSWFSPMTGTILFVNHRGQKLPETTIDQVAIQMDRQQAFIVQDLQVGLVDRAWASVKRALATFAGTEVKA